MSDDRDVQIEEHRDVGRVEYEYRFKVLLRHFTEKGELVQGYFGPGRVRWSSTESDLILRLCRLLH